jgi:23S rRNA (guanosine2251-2'-O)-methyltransferase
MFCTVLHSLKSPQNVGTIVRSHVAFGGGPVVFVGHHKPWQFRKGTQAFSRKLERLAELIFLPDDDSFFAWCSDNRYMSVAIEISSAAAQLPQFAFPARAAIIVGNEGLGLATGFLERCDNVVAIPQFGPAECLNVGVSCSIALYELSRQRSDSNAVVGAKYARTHEPTLRL